MGVRFSMLTLHSSILYYYQVLTAFLARAQEVDFQGQALAEKIYTYILTGAGVRRSKLAPHKISYFCLQRAYLLTILLVSHFL